jgi:hypothetical protein
VVGTAQVAGRAGGLLEAPKVCGEVRSRDRCVLFCEEFVVVCSGVASNSRQWRRSDSSLSEMFRGVVSRRRQTATGGISSGCRVTSY